MSLVYLCGPITGLTYDEARNGWRRQVSVELARYGIDCLSPMRAKDHLRKQSTMEAMGYALSAMSCSKGITSRDRYDTQRSDLVLCNVIGAKEKSLGSAIEFGWADSARVPIVLAMEPGNVHEHAMVNEVASFIVPTIEEATAIVRAILVPGV